MPKKNTLVGCSLTLLILVASCAAWECKELGNAPPQELVSYLESATLSSQNAECVTYAIERLGLLKYEPAVPALARLLDFRRPLTSREKHGIYLHVQTVEEIYPAANALQRIGKGSEAAVLDAIRAGRGSEQARDNAVFVWMEIFKYEAPEGVARLKHEADETADVAEKGRLTDALSKALKWCNPPDKEKCKAAAKG